MPGWWNNKEFPRKMGELKCFLLFKVVVMQSLPLWPFNSGLLSSELRIEPCVRGHGCIAPGALPGETKASRPDVALFPVYSQDNRARGTIGSLCSSALNPCRWVPGLLSVWSCSFHSLFPGHIPRCANISHAEGIQNLRNAMKSNGYLFIFVTMFLHKSPPRKVFSSTIVS